MNKLLDAYSGDKARDYDTRRSKSRRWRNEVSAMEAYLSEISPRRVIDCPFGTGRWIPQYDAIEAEVIGIDLSSEMLKMARQKLDASVPGVAARYDLREASIFDLEKLDLRGKADLVACIRFVNWVSFEDTKNVIQQLTAIGSKDMIVGASVVPVRSSLLRRVFFALGLATVNAQQKDRRRQYVHDEANLLEIFRINGWNLVGKSEIMRRVARVNYFYHLRRA